MATHFWNPPAPSMRRQLDRRHSANAELIDHPVRAKEVGSPLLVGAGRRPLSHLLRRRSRLRGSSFRIHVRYGAKRTPICYLSLKRVEHASRASFSRQIFLLAFPDLRARQNPPEVKAFSRRLVSTHRFNRNASIMGSPHVPLR